MSRAAQDAAGPSVVNARQLILLFCAGFALVGLVILVGSLYGPVPIRPGPGWQFWGWPLWRDSLWQSRFLRLLLAAVAGGGLAVGGAAIQGLLRNPLADPYVLGISTGAGVGVRLGTVLLSRGLLPAAVGAWMATPLLAFAGACAAGVCVYRVARQRGHLDPFSILLGGIIVGTVNTALIMALSLFVELMHADDFTRWGLGEIPDSVSPVLLGVTGVLVAGGALYLFLRAASLNVLGLGEDVAASLGVRVARLRVEVFVAVSAITAATVALAGPISFVGLIVPHAVRMLAGPDHRRLLPAAAWGGAVFLVLAEVGCRFVGHAAGIGRIPVGIVTALCGGPFFIYLMRRHLRESGL